MSTATGLQPRKEDHRAADALSAAEPASGGLRPLLRRYGDKVLLGVASFGLLYLSTLLYFVGETLLGSTVLVVAALAIWAYTSAKTQAMRYLFPGIAAAAVFVVFPMVYTIQIGFTNYSSENLLHYERARQYLLDETIRDEQAPLYRFSLLAEGQAYRIKLENPGKADEVWLSPPLPLTPRPEGQPGAANAPDVALLTASEAAQLGKPLALREVIARQNALRDTSLTLPDGSKVKFATLRTFAATRQRYTEEPDGALRDTLKDQRVVANFTSGFFETTQGERVLPGFRVDVGLAHFKRIFTDPKFSEPFTRIFFWTVTFSALTVVFATALGILLGVLLSWESLRGRKVYQVLLFLPYAVPGFISILIFKGLFNQNLGEINMILDGLFGIRPGWFSDPFLAKVMLLTVNTWLGFPYMMIVCLGMIKSIPSDLYEASAVAGAGPLTNFLEITLPLILKPMLPLMIASFAFNFNNFVLITLLTGGRPDFLDIGVPAGTTDILVSYTFRIAFQDSGQQFGLASAVSTVIFLIVAAVTVIQMRFTRLGQQNNRK